METAKIDIRKLQLLNDRICQTIEALNQVRLTVHGISHSNPYLPQNQPQVGLGLGGYGMGVGQTIPYGPYGIGHTTLPVNTLGQMTPTPWLGGYLPVSQFPQGQWLGGISHTSFVNDPFWAQRCAQTFPYVGAAYSPYLGVF
jgi:hypothetical protein